MFVRRSIKIPTIQRVFHIQPNVVPTPANISEVFRVDRIEHHNLKLELSLFELYFMFRIAARQHPITARNIVQHQGSTELIGTTSCKNIAKKLAESWIDDPDCTT